ncbi:ComEC/Rec2 family competence protein [Devosia oryzisoli]|uniref:ComEC/Rec2 family competence protein n=1 Tax=Devosia oryzisoli TaxID=2774138 RepID=UPI0031F5BD94
MALLAVLGFTAAIVCSLTGLRLAVQLSALWLGFCLLPIHGALFGTPMLAFPAYGTYEARVDEIISADSQAQRVVVSQLLPLEDARELRLRRARLFLPAEPVLSPGDRIQVALRLAPIPGPVLPGGYDGQFHSYFSGIGAYGSATGHLEVIATNAGSGVARAVHDLRTTIARRIENTLDGSSAPIAKAMIVGDQSGITDETRDVLAAAGLAHIYSISGLHLSIVAGGIYWLVRLLLASMPFTLTWPIKKIAAMAGLFVAFAYLLLAGGVNNVPAFRSTLMLALVFGAVLAGRQALTMRNVAIAAIVIILLDPASIFRPSFQLSFAAVVGLIGVYELPWPRRAGTGSVGRITSTLLATAWTSFIAGGATLLFSAYHFQQTAPLGVLGNLLALPFVSLVIMPFGVLSVLLMPLALDAPALVLTGWGIDRMMDIAVLVAGWSRDLSSNPLLAPWALLAGLLALAWFALLDTRWRVLGPAAAIPFIVLLGFEPRPDVLIADTTQAVAVRDGDGLSLVSGRAGSFATEVWGQHYQTPIEQDHRSERCDSLGCIVSLPEFSVAVVRNAAAFAEDCGAHELLVTRIDPPQWCRSEGLVIGPDELERGGVQWLHWNQDAGRFDVRPAIDHLNRPWRVLPR